MTEKVLLLGNGIAREYYKGANWDKVLDKIRDKTSYPMPSIYYKIPMPLKAEMFTKGQLQSKIKEEEDLFSLPPKTDHEFVRKLLDLNFTHILTTNYTYEVDCAQFRNETKEVIKYNELAPLHHPERTESDSESTHLSKNYDALINTYNKIGNIDIWHIHGEAFFPESIVLGHESYGYLLKKYIEHFENPYSKTWLDAFVNGDVYILGFGMDFSEIDLWWLLQYKHKLKHNNETTATYFFNPQPDNPDDSALQQYIQGTSEWCKLQMLKTCGVKIIDIKFNNILDDKSISYKGFYEKALAKIQKYVPKRNSNR